MRTLFSLLAALMLTFGLATAVSAQDSDEPVATNEGEEESAVAGDAAAADTAEGEVAVADDVVAVDTDDADDGDDNGDDGDDGGTTAPPTNLPKTGIGAVGGAGTGLLAAIVGLFATATAAVSMRLRR
ncbi:MAG: hypothetical protein M3411_05735 [Chloroflexota bacterium]|nr:hypothetical protein [Chloroflexota bacterium]